MIVSMLKIKGRNRRILIKISRGEAKRRRWLLKHKQRRAKIEEEDDALLKKEFD